MRFDRRLKPKTAIDLTPLVDVVFILVLFFMVSSVFKTSPGVELDLPQSSTTTSVVQTDIHITAVSNDEVYLNRSQMPLSALDKAIEPLLAGKKTEDIRVVVEGDKDAPYQVIISVLDVLRKRHVQGVNLITKVAR